MHKLYNLKYSDAKFHRTKGEIVKSINIVGKFTIVVLVSGRMSR